VAAQPARLRQTKVLAKSHFQDEARMAGNIASYMLAVNSPLTVLFFSVGRH
jgi:hypothetical protein